MSSELIQSLVERAQNARAQKKSAIDERLELLKSEQLIVITTIVDGATALDGPLIKSIVEAAPKCAESGAGHMKVYIDENGFEAMRTDDEIVLFVPGGIMKSHMTFYKGHEQIADELSKKTAFKCIVQERSAEQRRVVVDVVWDEAYYAEKNTWRKEALEGLRTRILGRRANKRVK